MHCSGISSAFGSAVCAAKSMCFVVISDQGHVGQSEKPAALQSKVAGQVGKLFVDEVVVSEFFL